MTMQIPSSDSFRAIVGLEDCQACFLIKHEKDFNGVMIPSIFIQALDAYGIQMEYSLKLRNRYLHEKQETVYYYESHAYFHPGLRSREELKEVDGECLFARLIERVEKYPSLLFNSQTEKRGRNEGFMRFLCALIHYGEKHSVKTLENC